MDRWLQITRKDIGDWQEIAAVEGLRPEFVFVHIDKVEWHWQWPVETFDHYELVYVRSGHLTMWLNEEPVRGGKADMFVVAPGVAHREESPRGRNSCLLCLATRLRNKGGKECCFPLDLPPRIHLGAGHAVERCMEGIANDAYHRRIGYAAVIESLTRQIFIELLRESRGMKMELLEAGQIRRNRLASGAKAFIEAHYAEPLSLASLSQHFFMSPYRFSHVFKQVNGAPPMAYLTKVRMDNAKRLLGDPELPVKAVAAEVGYGDEHYFSRVFAQEQGMTPSAYRRAHLLPE